MIRYYDLGKDKKLNEIVIAGSHDAGISEGGSNIQTQSLDIEGQALAYWQLLLESQRYARHASASLPALQREFHRLPWPLPAA